MASTAGFYVGKVEGVAEVMKALNELKPKLYAEAIDRMQDEAEGIAADVNRSMPNEAPLSGFNHEGATSWGNKGEASAKPSQRLLPNGQDWPIYKISLGGYASAVTDIAGAGGRGNTPQGEAMIAMLNSRFGRASRWVWPVAKRHEQRVVRKIEQACRKVEDELSARIAARR